MLLQYSRRCSIIGDAGDVIRSPIGRLPTIVLVTGDATMLPSPIGHLVFGDDMNNWWW